MPNEAACFPAAQIPPDGRSAGLSPGPRRATARRGQREGRGEHPPERDSIAPYSPASNFAMASRNASP